MDAGQTAFERKQASNPRLDRKYVSYPLFSKNFYLNMIIFSLFVHLLLAFQEQEAAKGQVCFYDLLEQAVGR